MGKWAPEVSRTDWVQYSCIHPIPAFQLSSCNTLLQRMHTCTHATHATHMHAPTAQPPRATTVLGKSDSLVFHCSDRKHLGPSATIRPSLKWIQYPIHAVKVVASPSWLSCVLSWLPGCASASVSASASAHEPCGLINQSVHASELLLSGYHPAIPPSCPLSQNLSGMPHHDDFTAPAHLPSIKKRPPHVGNTNCPRFNSTRKATGMIYYRLLCRILVTISLGIAWPGPS